MVRQYPWREPGDMAWKEERPTGGRRGLGPELDIEPKPRVRPTVRGGEVPSETVEEKHVTSAKLRVDEIYARVQIGDRAFRSVWHVWLRRDRIDFHRVDALVSTWQHTCATVGARRDHEGHMCGCVISKRNHHNQPLQRRAQDPEWLIVEVNQSALVAGLREQRAKLSNFRRLS